MICFHVRGREQYMKINRQRSKVFPYVYSIIFDRWQYFSNGTFHLNAIRKQQDTQLLFSMYYEFTAVNNNKWSKAKSSYQYSPNKTERTTIWVKRLQCFLHQTKYDYDDGRKCQQIVNRKSQTWRRTAKKVTFYNLKDLPVLIPLHLCLRQLLNESLHFRIQLTIRCYNFLLTNWRVCWCHLWVGVIFVDAIIY